MLLISDEKIFPAIITLMLRVMLVLFQKFVKNPLGADCSFQPVLPPALFIVLRLFKSRLDVLGEFNLCLEFLDFLFSFLDVNTLLTRVLLNNLSSNDRAGFTLVGVLTTMTLAAMRRVGTIRDGFRGAVVARFAGMVLLYLPSLNGAVIFAVLTTMHYAAMALVGTGLINYHDTILAP
jgi:hypothetical protein